MGNAELEAHESTREKSSLQATKQEADRNDAPTLPWRQSERLLSLSKNASPARRSPRPTPFPEPIPIGARSAPSAGAPPKSRLFSLRRPLRPPPRDQLEAGAMDDPRRDGGEGHLAMPDPMARADCRAPCQEFSAGWLLLFFFFFFLAEERRGLARMACFDGAVVGREEARDRGRQTGNEVA